MTDAEPNSAPEAIGQLYHAWITGLVLSLVARRGADPAERFVFALFRRQHLERFLPGLEKLGLTHEPHAVAAAKYHYLSNQLGGVAVEYLEESPTKAWVRYPPPRWIWMGTAICGVPGNVNRAMLRGWHAHNGVTLGNPRLGFVCTKTTVDGQPGLEGYYREFDRDLAPEARLQFRPHEICPPIDPASLPTLSAAEWPPARQARAYRNYAMEYIRNALPILAEEFGPEEARYIGRIAGLQIGMHTYPAVAGLLGVSGDDAASFAAMLARLWAASGDEVEQHGTEVSRTGWKLFPQPPAECVLDGWLAAWEGLLACHNRFLQLKVLDRTPLTVAVTPGRG